MTTITAEALCERLKALRSRLENRQPCGCDERSPSYACHAQGLWHRVISAPHPYDDRDEAFRASRDVERSQPSVCASLHSLPRRDLSVDVLDVDLLCEDVP
jgi:hypothetical protein